jgi:phage shock protein C
MAHRQHRRGHCSAKHNGFNGRKNNGWGMNLYRNTREGKIAGVSAGLADHWGIAHWVVRLMWVGAFLFTGTLAIWLYIAAWVLLSPRPARRTEDGGPGYDSSDWRDDGLEMEYDEHLHEYRPKNVFRYGGSTSERLACARERLDAALRRVEDMESYVTSRQYNLNKEFSKL